MSQLIIKNKGKKTIYLTRNYNSLAPFNANKDDVGFNNDTNEFSTYCLNSGCSDWANDMIKIISLPDKGRLYFNANPTGLIPDYQEVIVGQLILVRDMIDYKALRFNAEGLTNQQFSGNYLTGFTFERYCGATGSNIIVEIKLNMLDAQVAVSAITVAIARTCQSILVSPYPVPTFNTNCIGWNIFSVSQFFNSNSGFIRMTVNGGSQRLYLNKYNGNPMNNDLPVNANEIISITTQLMGSLRTNSSFPGYPIPPVVTYTFQYSMDGISNWTDFTIQLKQLAP